jgi:hypothetical protein
MTATNLTLAQFLYAMNTPLVDVAPIAAYLK